tara:strand:- start:112 stop:1986 length:1875 start_codon:yes stop_codon:yes gene_type:complete
MADETLKRLNQLVEEPDTSFLGDLRNMGRDMAAQPNGAEVYASLTPEERMRRAKEGAYTVASFAPGTGEIISGKESVEDFQKGNYGMATLGALGAIPLLGYAPRLAKGLLRSSGNFVNQVATDMPTFIKDFYSGNPFTAVKSFGKEAVAHVPQAVKARIDPAARAFEETWGTSETKVKDIIGEGAPAERLRAKGKGDEAVGLNEDAEKTALAIEAQKGKDIIPVDQRGALAQGVDGLTYYDRAIDIADADRIAAGIGNGFRTETNIPDNVVNKFTRHVTEGPHVKTGDGRLYEVQVKSLESSRTVGNVESAGFAAKGSALARAFNTGTEAGKSVSPFDSYIKTVSNATATKGSKVTTVDPRDVVEFTQLAATLDKKTTIMLNQMLDTTDLKVTNAQLLDRISKARLYQRTGKKPTPTQAAALKVFDEAVGTGAIKPATLRDEAGNVVSSLDYNNIKKPEGFMSTQTSYASEQKELGGVNHMFVVDPYNQVNYSMISDGHDIFGLNPAGGHPLITVQPITMEKWGTKGFTKQHKTMNTRENVAAAVQRTEELTGIPAPKGTRNATGKDYLANAKKYTKKAMTKPVAAEKRHIDAANASKVKLAASGTVGLSAGVGTGMMMSNNEE